MKLSEQLRIDHESGDFGQSLEGMADRAEVMEEALNKITTWFGQFPESGRTWPDGEPMSYAAAFGSNGERDYMRVVAQKALDKSGG
jgi:hypothetical protein